MSLKNGPSQHLSWAEMACKDGTPYPEEWRTSRAVPLALEFEIIRAKLGGKPIDIGSAYRTPAHNIAVGGARLSQHPQGRALDLYPPEGVTMAALWRAAREVSSRGVLRGLGLYRTFVHVDIRPSVRLVVWAGAREMAELVRIG